MRLIDAEKLLEVLKGMHGIEHTRYDDGLYVAEAVVDVAETIDTVKHGHWIKHNTIGSATCSECDGVIYNAYDKSANKFCHVCGAKMDEKDYE